MRKKLWFHMLAALLFTGAFGGIAYGDSFSTSAWNSAWTFSGPADASIGNYGDDGSPSHTGELRMNVGAYDDQFVGVDNGAKMLKSPRGTDPTTGLSDWQIDTDLRVNTSASGQSTATGLVIYKDVNNWIQWGVLRNNSMEVHAVLGGTFYAPLNGVGISGTHELMRIIKRSVDSTHARYYFYYADDATKWTCAGYWEDTGDIFASGYKYGLMTKSWGNSFSAQYDYFYDTIPVNETDEFPTSTLDKRWNYASNAGSSYGISSDQLSLNVASASDLWIGVSDAPRVLRKPKYGDWIVDTRIDGHPGNGNNNYGMLIYKDSQNWLQWGYLGNGTMEVSGLLNNTFSGALGTVGSQHARQRITKTGNIYKFEYSDDGLAWTSALSWTDSSNRLAGAQYGLFGKSWSGEPAYTVKYAFFRERMTYNGTVKSVSEVVEKAKLTGAGSINNTSSLYNFGGGDVATMTELGNKVYMTFGDNFSGFFSGTWHSNAMAVTSDTTPEDGLTFDAYPNGMINDGTSSHNVKEIIAAPFRGTTYNEVTVIPTNGVSYHNPSTGVDTLYVPFMSIYRWGAGPQADVNYAEYAVSTDYGQTFTRSTAVQWGPNSNFIQLAIAKDPNSGTPKTVYVFGVPSGPWGDVKVAKTTEDKILDSTSYTYWNGSSWVSNESAAVTIIPGPVREFSVQYNAYTGRWLFMTDNDMTADIEIRDAASPTGPWSRPLLALDHTTSTSIGSNSVQSAIYAPFMTPKYMDNTNGYLYVTMTKWADYNVYWERLKLEK